MAPSKSLAIAPAVLLTNKCFYWSCCTEYASVCGGWQPTGCNSVNTGSLISPPDFEHVKRAAKLKEKGKKEGRKTAKKKYRTATTKRARTRASKEPIPESLAKPLFPDATVAAKKGAQLNIGPSHARGPCHRVAGLTQELIGHEQEQEHATAVNSTARKTPPGVAAKPTMVVVGAATAETSETRACAAPDLVSTRCFYWPFCTNDTQVCGGRHHYTCKLVSDGSIILPLDFEKARKRARQKECRDADMQEQSDKKETIKNKILHLALILSNCPSARQQLWQPPRRREVLLQRQFAALNVTIGLAAQVTHQFMAESGVGVAKRSIAGASSCLLT
jgi:hypothetical protein